MIPELKKISLLLVNSERHEVKLHVFLRSSSLGLDGLGKKNKDGKHLLQSSSRFLQRGGACSCYRTILSKLHLGV